MAGSTIFMDWLKVPHIMMAEISSLSQNKGSLHSQLQSCTSQNQGSMHSPKWCGHTFIADICFMLPPFFRPPPDPGETSSFSTANLPTDFLLADAAILYHHPREHYAMEQDEYQCGELHQDVLSNCVIQNSKSWSHVLQYQLKGAR